MTEDRNWHLREAEKFRILHREAYARHLNLDARVGSRVRLDSIGEIEYASQAMLYHATMASALPEVRHRIITEHLPDPHPDESYAFEDIDGDLWAWIPGYGWGPVRVNGEWYDGDKSGLSGFPKFKHWKKLLR